MEENFDGIIEKLDIGPTSSGPLSGLTFAVKDMFDLEGRTCSFGTPDWKRTHSPAVKNAPSVQQLLDAGAHLKFNACADELACSLDGINVHYGTPINPQAPDRIPGGSSSGSASLVARGEVDFALGTDTAGSVRVPASYCGIFGFRPSHDYISIEGVCPLGASFDTVGVFARTSEWLETVSGVLLRRDRSYLEEDSIPTNLIVPEQFASVLDPLIAPYMMAFLDDLKRRFKTVREQNFYKHARDVYDVFTVVRAREAWSAHAEWLERVKPNLATSIRQRIYSCRDISDAAFERSSAARAELLRRSDEVVDDTSFICLPTTWGFPPLKSASEGELQDNRNRNIVITTLASCYGFPQITIPIPVGRMKLGISIMGAKGSDKALLRFVKELTTILAFCLCLFMAAPAAFAEDSMVTFNAPVSAPHHDVHINYALNPLNEKYYVWVPPNFSRAQAYGLIVYTSPVDQTGIPAGWAEVLARQRFLFVAPQNAGNSVNIGRRAGLGVLGALEMMHSYRIDPSRVYAAGLSGGARTASALGFWQPDIFRGTIQDCGSDFYRAVARRDAPQPTSASDARYGLLESTSLQAAGIARSTVKFVLITGPGDFRHGYLLDIYNNGFVTDGFRAKLFDVPGMGHQDCSGAVLEQALTYLR